MDRDDTIALVVVLAVGGLLAWYLLRPAATSTTTTTTRSSCGGAEGAASAVASGVAGAKGVKIDPGQLCSVLQSIEKGGLSIAMSIAKNPVSKAISSSIGSVDNLLHGSNDPPGTPFNRMTCDELKNSIKAGTNGAGCSGYNGRTHTPNANYPGCAEWKTGRCGP